VDTPLDQRQLALSRDLLAEPGAAPAEDAALAVEDDLVGERHPFIEVRLRKFEAAGAGAILEGLVLQRAFAALIADRAVEGEVDLVGLHRRHYATASCAVFLKGQPFSETCSRNSSRKYLMTLRGNQVEASPSGQKERPSMLYPMSRSRSTSVALASPASKRSKRFDIQKVPSRHGVHLPQLSWWK